MNKKTKLAVIALLLVTLLLSLFATVACGPKDEPNDPSKPEDPSATYYTVTFDSMGGSAVNSQRVKEGEKVTKPANPTKGNAQFLGWFTGTDASATEYDFNKAVYSDFTLYAKWGGVQGEYYSVQFDANGGQPVIEFSSYEYGTKLSAPTSPTRLGYSFGGWYTDVSCTAQASFPYTVSGDVTFYAKWTNTRQTKVYYRVARLSGSTFDIDYSEDILTPTTIDRGAKLEQPANPKDITYTDSSNKQHTLKFSYWSNRSTYQNNHTHAILFPEYKTDREEMTIYAVYVEVGATDEYAKLTIHPENGEKDTVMYGIKGKTIGIANLDQANDFPFYTDGSEPRYAGHRVTGYYKSRQFTADNVYRVPFSLDNAENDVYLRWEEQDKLTVTFDLNYDGKKETQQFSYNGYVTRISDPIRVGYTFDGWYNPYDLADEDNLWNFNYNKATNNFTLYAKWVKTATVLTFDTRGGAERNPIALSKNTQLTKLPFASRQEKQDTVVYDFLGWYADSGYGKLVSPSTSSPFTLSEDTTLYAKWSDAIDVSKLNFNVYSSGYTVNIVNGEQNNIYGVVTIPAYYNGIKVFGIDPQGFKDCKYITEVNLSDNLVYLYADAFYGCSRLKKVHLSDDTRQIAGNAFYNCTELEEVNFPANGNLYSVYASIFRTNPKMWSQLESDRVTETCTVRYWGTACLGSGYYTPKYEDTSTSASKSQVTSVTESYTVREGTTVVATYAFVTWSEVKTITLPDSVIYVTEYAFPAEKDLTSVGYGSSLTTVNLSKNLETGRLPLYFPSTLESINLPSDNKYYELKNGCLIIKSEKKLIASVKGATAIPEGVATVGEYSFRNKSLQTVTIPNSVTTVMQYAFQGCQFTSIKIPDSVGVLDETAFTDCKNLVSIELGKQVPLQKATLFSNTKSSKIANVTVNDGNASMRTINSVLYNRKTAEIIYVAPAYSGEMYLWEETETLPDNMFRGSYTVFYIPAGITVEEGALGNVKRIDKLILGENMPEISQAWLFGSLFAPRWAGDEWPVGAIELEGDNPNMTVIDGILYNKSVTKMLFVPAGVTELVMPDTLTEVDDGVGLYSLERLVVGKSITLSYFELLLYGDPDAGRFGLDPAIFAQSVEVSAENPDLTVFDGVVYTKDLQRLVYIPVGFSGDLVLPKEMKEFSEIAFYRTSVLCDADYTPTEIIIDTLKVEEGSQLQSIRSYTLTTSQVSDSSLDDDAKTRLPAWYKGTMSDNYQSTLFNIKKIDLTNATLLSRIGEAAFSMQATVTEVALPDSVEYYGMNSFGMFNNLTKLTGGNFANAEIDSFLGFTPSEALCDDNGFFIIGNTLMGLNSSKFPSGSEIVIPSRVTTVQTGAFLALSPRSITIPTSVSVMRAKSVQTTFSTTVLNFYFEAAEIPSGFAENWYKTADGTQVNIFLDYLNTESTLNYYTDSYGLYYELNAETLTAKLINDATANDSWSGAVTLPQTIEYKGKVYTLTEIGKQAMYMNYKSNNVTAITIPDTVVAIGEDSFGGMRSLIELVLPNGLTELPYRALVGLDSLEKVTVPANVTVIPSYAFYRCQKLHTVVFKGVVTEIDTYAFYWCSKLANIELSNVTKFGNYAMGYCEALASVNFAKGVVIGDYAFDGCGLTSIDLTNVGELGANAFYKCTSLIDVNLGNLEVLPEGTFNGCSALKYIDLSNIKTISNSVFGNCTSLAEIVVSSELTSIGNSVFYRCSKLKYVYCLGTEEQWKTVTVGTNNDPLKSVAVYYYSAEEPAKRADGVPDYDGNWWHWEDNRPVIWVYSEE